MPLSATADRFAQIFGRVPSLVELESYRRARAQIELRQPPRVASRPIIGGRQ